MVGTQTHGKLLESYLDWWTVSGAFCTFDAEPIPLLKSTPDSPTAEYAKPSKTPIGLSPASETLVQKHIAPAPSTAKNILDAIHLPHTLGEFQEWLAHNALLPGAKWSVTRALPTGAANPRLMIIGDKPDTADIAESRIFSGAAGNLLDAMLSAIHLSPEQVYKSSIALTVPMPGAMTNRDKQQLAHIARHHVKLVNPDYVLLLGQNTSITLLGQDVTIPTQSLRDFNHIAGTTPCIGTFHPRAMLLQPALKKQAWSALKVLLAAMQTTG